MTSKRRTRIGIVTNRMSDRVYNHLEEKAQTNELSQYIIKLVEYDLEHNIIQEQFRLVKKELQDLYKEIEKAKQFFQPKEPTLVYSDQSATSLIELKVVSDEEVIPSGFDEPIDLDF